MENKESFVPIEEIADHFSVSVSTIRSWVRRKHISPNSFIKVGSTYRFKISDVTDSLLSNGARVDPTEEGAKATVRSLQEEAEDKVKSYIRRKEAASPAEMEDLFDEDM